MLLISMVDFIHRHLIFPGVTNMIFFPSGLFLIMILISMLNLEWLSYILIFSIILLKEFISSSSFLVNHFESLKNHIIFSTNKAVLVHSWYFFSFLKCYSCLVALENNARTRLHNREEQEHLLCYLISGKYVSSFPTFIIIMLVWWVPLVVILTACGIN